MVRLTAIRLFSSATSYKLPTYLSESRKVIVQKPKNFIDSVRISVQGGDGGTGLPAYGGKGGKGGDVIFKCDSNLDSLKKLKVKLVKLRSIHKKFKGQNGEDSFKYKLVGEDGKNFIIGVPPGCTLKNEEGGYIGEIDKELEQVLLPIGGEGGCKENNYIGRLGSKMTINIDLKLISDVGFIGFPNSGKSTLLKALTRARPKIANIPFTTITPNIGIIEYPDYRKISLADLPGLVKGAHVDVGLGHKFLKHVVRTKLLMFVIAAEQLKTIENEQGYSPIEVLLTLMKEIELYDETIMKKPVALVLTKFDLPNARKVFDEFLADLERVKELDFSNIKISENYIPNRLMKFSFILPVSSKTSFNIRELQKQLREHIDLNFEDELRNKGEIMSFDELVEKEKLNKKKN